MLPYKTLLGISRNSGPAVYLQLANQLIQLIQRGILRPGTALPSIRVLAQLIEVDPNTVVAVYSEMATQGWVTSIPKKGVFVSSLLPEVRPKPTVSRRIKKTKETIGQHLVNPQPRKASGDHRYIVNDGFPDARIAPIDLLMRQYRKLYHNSSIQRKAIFGEVNGSRNLRQSISRFLAETRGMRVTSEKVCITRGAQMALYLTARALLKSGSRVVVGEPNYPFANGVFEACGANLIRIPVDEHGMDISSLERHCQKKKPDLLYIIPHHHHPTTVTLSSERRMRLLDIVHHHNITVIEDDYDYDFHYNSSPILPLASYDHHDLVIYIGSLSKSFTSTIKMGYLIAAPERLATISQARKLVDIRGDTFMEEALASLFRTGDMARHLRKSVQLYKERRDYLYQSLTQECGDSIICTKPAGGMAIWVQFHPSLRLPEISKIASRLGLYLSDGSFYNTGNKNYNGLRIGFASLTASEIKEIVSIIRQAIIIHKSGR